MFEEQLKILLEKKWTEEELQLINRLTSNLGYYKKLIPKSLKQDITEALQMCNVLKVELEKFKETCKCNLGSEVEHLLELEDTVEKTLEAVDTAVKSE
jgi:hypothetical protein